MKKKIENNKPLINVNKPSAIDNRNGHQVNMDLGTTETYFSALSEPELTTPIDVVAKKQGAMLNTTDIREVEEKTKLHRSSRSGDEEILDLTDEVADGSDEVTPLTDDPIPVEGDEPLEITPTPKISQKSKPDGKSIEDEMIAKARASAKWYAQFMPRDEETGKHKK